MNQPAPQLAEPLVPEQPKRPPLLGRLAYHLLPLRRRTVLENMRRAYGSERDAAEIVKLAQAFYGHFAQFLVEFMRFSAMSRTRRARLVRVEGKEAVLRAADPGKGVLILTGHFGNWEVATVGAIEAFPQYRDRLHILRRPINPALLDRFITRRFRRAGLEIIPKRGSLDHLLACLQRGDAVVFIMDQHAGGRDGVLVDFFGYPAWTFRSLAVIALSTGAPVVPATAWREADGTHVLRFEEALSTIDHVKPGEAIRANTQLYNRALERIIRRHPEQWIWMHRRWKDA